MNIRVDKTQEEHFAIEDIVSYSNIEVSHVNDNKAPMRVVATKFIVGAVLISIIAALFFF